MDALGWMYSLGMCVIGVVLGLWVIIGIGIYASGRAFDRAVRATEAEDISRMEVSCPVFPGVETVEDCRANSARHARACRNCVAHGGAGGLHV